MTSNYPDEHVCFSRGCGELVQGRYYCDRHEAILQAGRDAQARRNSERARERGQAAQPTHSDGRGSTIGVRGPRLFDLEPYTTVGLEAHTGR